MIIFIGGVHAVGKTYIAAPTAAKIGFRHATASELIKSERGAQTWSGDKRVNDVEENQRALVRAVGAARARKESLLLDGHFALRGSAGQTTRIDVGVFRDMKLGGIIVLNAPSELILQRLRAREDQSWTVGEIDKLASEELEHSKLVARELEIPWYALSSPAESEFLLSVRQIYERNG
ncbi:ATP-binding protein [Ralstonia solanacearum]|uniref:ATP-binding protein n=1 Tax=Ralstonia solanacearum TaxID=305 RepID=UPI0018C2B46A|nr:ATP-binding protein [Ralstonia solanacearum]